MPEDPARACLRGHRALEKFVRGCFCVSVLLRFGSRLLGLVTLISVPLHSVPTCSVHGYARARSKSLPGRCLESPKCSKSLFGGRLECCRLTARNHKRSHSSKSRLCASLLGCTSPGSSIAPCMYMHGYTLVYIYGGAGAILPQTTRAASAYEGFVRLLALHQTGIRQLDKNGNIRR